MGLMLAEPEFHTRCFVEREEYPREVLIAAQEAGYLQPAPIWDDVTTFDARPFAGAFDTLLAGYPCQPFSQAGQRKGEDDERHLWPDIERIIKELGPDLRWCFFENVAGHLTLGLETVVRSLRSMGFRVAVGTFSAAEVGATHERLRVFIVAYREGSDRRCEQSEGREGSRGSGLAGGGAEPNSRNDTQRCSGDAVEDARRTKRRSINLRLLGNGVVPLVAAHAWRTLSAAHGLGWLDLGAAGGGRETRTDEHVLTEAAE